MDSFEAEVGEMKQLRDRQRAADNVVLDQRRADLEAFKDAESQDRPCAGRLEEIARVELTRWIAETILRQKSLEESKLNYNQMREELVVASKKVFNGSELKLLRSVVSVAETGIRQAQTDLQEALDGMNDAELLLKRALRIKQSQKETLPLFQLLCKDNIELSEVRLDLLVCAVTAMMDATYDQKCAFFFDIFDQQGEGLYSSTFINRVVVLFGEMFFRIGMLPAPPVEEDIRDSVYRSFKDIGLQFESDSLTVRESKRLLITLLSNAYPLAETLAVTMGFSGMEAVQSIYGKPSGLGGGFMGMYQRNKMTPVGLLLKGNEERE